MSTKAMSSAKKKEKTSLGACSHKKFFPFFLIGRMPVNEEAGGFRVCTAVPVI